MGRVKDQYYDLMHGDDSTAIITDMYLGCITKLDAFNQLVALGVTVDDAHHLVEDAYAYHHEGYDDDAEFMAEVHGMTDDVA